MYGVSWKEWMHVVYRESAGAQEPHLVHDAWYEFYLSTFSVLILVPEGERTAQSGLLTS